MTDMDYVVLYAKRLREDSSLFVQQKKLIDGQIRASNELFRNAFGKNFKKNAREYLKKRGLI
jgi:hypothetical protein